MSRPRDTDWPVIEGPKVVEQVVYTRQWAWEVRGRLVRDTARSVAFGVLLLLSLVFLFAAPVWIVLSGEPESDLFGGGPAVTGAGLTAATFLALAGLGMCVFCWWLALEVADDRHWEKRPPTVWDEREVRWITSTISFARYLESRGEHIEVSLIRYDDARAAAHRLIEQVDDRTLQLYLSLLSATQMEMIKAGLQKAPARLQDEEAHGAQA